MNGILYLNNLGGDLVFKHVGAEEHSSSLINIAYTRDQIISSFELKMKLLKILYPNSIM